MSTPRKEWDPDGHFRKVRKEKHPDLYLICDSCRALYKIIEDQPCLLDHARLSKMSRNFSL
mgnify:CR=1 FL=1